MNKIIDKFIDLFKWPMACFMLISIPAYVQSFYYFQFISVKFISLGVGFFLFFIARGMADASVKSSMQIIAHELTHTFFALLTLHKIKHLRVADDNSGGSMGFEGNGNWLIIIAPYFFPLFGFFTMIAISIYTSIAPMNFIINGVIGYFVGYHLDTVSSQIHEKQTDLPKVSYTFCWMFLPGANLWAIGCMLAFNSRGWDGVFVYQKLIQILNVRNFNYVLNLIF